MTTKPKKLLPADVVLDARDKEFWDAAARHQLVLHQCQVCKKHYWPASCCLDHGIEHMKWVPARGKGVLFTYTIYYRPLNPAWRDDVPYNFAVVELAEGPFMFGNIVGCANDDLKCGMPLEVVFDDVAPGVAVPKFKPVGTRP